MFVIGIIVLIIGGCLAVTSCAVGIYLYSRPSLNLEYWKEAAIYWRVRYEEDIAKVKANSPPKKDKPAPTLQ